MEIADIEVVELRPKERPDVITAHRVGEGVRGDRETWWNGQAGSGHRAEAGALAADDRLVGFVVVVEEDGVVEGGAVRRYHDTPS